MKFYKLSETTYVKHRGENIFRIVGSSNENFDIGTELQEVENNMSCRMFCLYDYYKKYYGENSIKLIPKDKEFQIHIISSDGRIEVVVLKIIETEFII